MKKTADSINNTSYSTSNYRREWEERRRMEREKELEEQKKILKAIEEEKDKKITKFLKEYPPSRIKAELDQYIIGQPELTKAVADFLYYQAMMFKYPLSSRPLLVCGPSGSGKTEVFRVAKKLYKDYFDIGIYDVSNLTSNGWAGTHKLSDHITPYASNSILVFDEADKLFSPRYSIGGVNTSADIQAEFLKVVEENEYVVKSKDAEYVVKNLGVVFLGAFESIRSKMTQPAGRYIGFGSQKLEQPIYQGIDSEMLVEYGMLSELVGRIATICNTKPITQEQCLNIVLNSKSRLKNISELLEQNGIDPWRELPDERIMQIINESNFETFGVRGVLSKIETIMLDSIHEQGLIFVPSNAPETPEVEDDEITRI